MLWKIVLQIIAVLTGIVIANLDYLWHDKRTLRFKRTRLFLYLLATVTLILSIVVTIQDDRQHEEEKRQLTSKLDKLQAETSALRNEAKSSTREQQSQMQVLIDGNKRLQDALSPFESMAKARYPNLPSDAALKKLQTDITSLQTKTTQLEQESKKSARGIYSRYDFNGVKREASGGRISAIAGEEFGIFQKLVELEKKRDYQSLLRECSKAIEKSPDWLTPYFFQGVAFANLGNRKAAIASLQHVVDNAPSDPDYAQAEELLKKLKE